MQGWLWRHQIRPYTDAWIWLSMTYADCAEVIGKTSCFTNGSFNTLDGTLNCVCSKRKGTSGLNHCEEEYACDIIASFIIIPLGTDMHIPDAELAKLYDVQEEVVRFRRLLETCILRSVHNTHAHSVSMAWAIRAIGLTLDYTAE